jgi:hypothetical protein
MKNAKPNWRCGNGAERSQLSLIWRFDGVEKIIEYFFHIDLSELSTTGKGTNCDGNDVVGKAIFQSEFDHRKGINQFLFTTQS